jgi:DNA-binding MarR family transcriptional regulator
MSTNDFDLRQFLPYVLNRAAEVTSIGFQQHYRDKYGMLRTEWRVLFHLGRYGGMTAKEICARAGLHKTKVSRAVRALEQKRFLNRTPQEQDRRLETLSLSPQGQTVYADLSAAARTYDEALAAQFTQEERDVLDRCLARLAGL